MLVSFKVKKAAFYLTSRAEISRRRRCAYGNFFVTRSRAGQTVKKKTWVLIIWILFAGVATFYYFYFATASSTIRMSGNSPFLEMTVSLLNEKGP